MNNSLLLPVTWYTKKKSARCASSFHLVTGGMCAGQSSSSDVSNPGSDGFLFLASIPIPSPCAFLDAQGPCSPPSSRAAARLRRCHKLFHTVLLAIVQHLAQLPSPSSHSCFSRASRPPVFPYAFMRRMIRARRICTRTGSHPISRAFPQPRLFRHATLLHA